MNNETLKPWQKKAKITQYKIEKISTNKTILIICEGQTEELYFKSFEVLTLSVKALGIGQSKLKLVESTLDIQNKENYDEVWCVYDLDIKKDERNCVPDFDNSIKKAKKEGFHVAYSNDAFELWFYLHYQYNDQENHRTFYYEQLSKLWNINYVKDGKKQSFCKNIYSLLLNDRKANMDKAINNAKKLYQSKKSLPYHKQNPVTKVYELVERLNQDVRK